MALPKSVSSIALLLCFLLAACTLPTSDSEEAIEISGPPVVTIASPLPNASYAEGVSVIIQASVSNAGEDINRVEISVDDTVIATQETPNPTGASVFSVTQSWTAEVDSQHTVTVIAFREDGTSSTPATVTINVIDPSTLGGNDDAEETERLATLVA